jgi:ribosomal protein S12 methylthiotransferase accessory factor
MERPRLKANYATEIVDDSKVFLLAEDSSYLVQGKTAVQVLPYLDGRHTIIEIVTALASTAAVSEVFLALRKFEAAGHLAEGCPDLPPDELAYWDALGVDPATAAARRSAGRLSVCALGEVDPGPVAAAMADAGLAVRVLDGPGDLGATGDPDELTVVLVDNYLSAELASVNEAFLASGRRWVIARPTGMALWCGPLFDPAHTGCWQCLAQRVSVNRQVEQYVMRRRGAGEGAGRPVRYPSAVAGATLLGGLLAQELVGVLTGAGAAGDRLVGKMISLDTRTLELVEHVLVRQPQCPACGDPALVTGRDGKVLLDDSQPALFTTEGGYRVQPPADTYERLKHHVSPVLGAVTSLTRFHGSENGVTHSYTAGHNFAMAGDSLALLRRNLRGQSGGKGRTDIQAKVSALCEAIERYSGVWRGDEPVITASYQQLGADLAVHPAELLMFSPAQEPGRAEWNADPANRLHMVPEPLPPDLPIEWSAAWSLTYDRERRVPAAYAWFGHPDLDRHFYCYSDSNGNAAGNTLEEAILQGFCELVERDAVAIWWYNRLPCPEFDLDCLDDPYIETLRRFYAEMDRTLHVLDITSDLSVPTFVGVSRRIGHPVEDILVGFGAHPDAAIAVTRALSEVNQFLPAVEQRDEHGETVYLEDDIATLAWWREAKLAEEPWLSPAPGTPARTLADYPSGLGGDLAVTVRDCVRIARDAGLEVIVLDQTRPDLAQPVVKVVVPGMRHFWRRLGPGRLYDVPVRTGRLATARTEAEMNPRSVFF